MLSNVVRKATRHFSVDFFHVTPFTDHFLRMARVLNEREVAFVLDVGANEGQYAAALLESGYAGEVISFEPLPEAWAVLQDRADKHPRWTAAPPMALGAEDGVTVFRRAGNNVSSSCLEMEQTHIDAAPGSVYVESLEVQLRRLDGLDMIKSTEGQYFLKIDAQGYEGPVIQGADSIMSRLMGLQLEMSLAPLYKDQLLAHEVDAELRGRGFECWDLIPGFRHPATLRLLQYDGVYFRDSGPTPKGAT